MYFPSPEGEWATVDPAAVGWDPLVLDAALDFAGRRASTGVVILCQGRILAEQYWRGSTQTSTRDVASVQKSVISVLIGIAARAGQLSVDDSVTGWLGAGWSRANSENESQILVRHLLSMSSGLNSRLNYTGPPGSSWYYNTPAYDLLHRILVQATGLSLDQYSGEVLFGPTGMSSGEWTLRVGPMPAHSEGGRFGLQLSARDMARFGLLVLADGQWEDQPVLDDPGYLLTSLTSSQPANPSYGWLWWLNGKSSHELPGIRPRPVDGPLIPSAPGDLVAALGTGDEKIYIVPSLDLVVTRLGRTAGPPKMAASLFDNTWWKALMAAAPRDGSVAEPAN